MDWIRAHKSLATILGVAIAGAVGLGVYLFLAYSTYSESSESLQALAKQVEGMEKAKLYPNQANLDEKADRVADYDEEVGKLASLLLTLQQDVTNKPIADTDLQAKFKQRVSEVREKSKGFIPKDFAFGFQDYLVSLPNADAVADLNDYFDAVDAISTAALDAGIKIDALTRSNLAVEKGIGKPKKKIAAPAPKPVTKPGKGKAKGKTKGAKDIKPAPPLAQMVERRIVTMDITCDQAPLQTLINTLASATAMKHFTVVRLLRIENERIDGPINKALPKPTDVAPKETQPPPPTPTAEPETTGPDGAKTPATPKAEVISAAKPEPADAVKVMGGEMLKAHLEIDVIRFLDPDSDTSPAEATK